MSAIIIDGKAVSTQIKDEIKQKVADLKENKQKTITLAVVLIGNDPASEVYVNNKIKACEYVGIVSQSYRLPENSTQNECEELISSLANDKSIDGILIQLPLPKHLNEESLLKIIPSEKDVDGLLDENIGKLFQNKKTLVSCTPNGVMQLLAHYNIETSGKNAVIIANNPKSMPAIDKMPFNCLFKIFFFFLAIIITPFSLILILYYIVSLLLYYYFHYLFYIYIKTQNHNGHLRWFLDPQRNNIQDYILLM